MKRMSAIACALLFVLSAVLLAQAPPQMPKPGTAHKRLQYLVGKWNGEFEMKESPMGPGGKGTSIEVNEMMPGGFFLIMHGDTKSPMGAIKGLATLGYNADEKVYTYHAVNNFGEEENYKGTIQGDTWTWTAESKINGKMMKSRYTMKEVSPTEYTYKFEMFADGKTWATIMEGKSTKAK